MQPALSLIWVKREDHDGLTSPKRRGSHANGSLVASHKAIEQQPPHISVTGSSSTNNESTGGYVGDDERPSKEELINSDDTNTTKTYVVRYYILLLFSVTSFMQYCAWNAFGPISTTCKAVFGWTNTEVAVMASLDPITYLLTMLFFSWMMDVKGLRKSMLIATFFMALGTGLRCITSEKGTVTWTMAAGQLFNGLAGPVTQAAPPLLSSNWFPPEQRTTATALASLCGSFGVALSFVIGPFAVKEIHFADYEHYDEHWNMTRDIDIHVHEMDFIVSPEYFADSIYKNASHYWPFDDATFDASAPHAPSQQMMLDIKSGHRGDLFGDARESQGVVNQSLTIPSSQGFASLGNYQDDCLEDILLCKNGLSVSFWLRYGNSTDDFQHILGTGDQIPGNLGFLVYHRPGPTREPTINVRFSTGHLVYEANVTVGYSEWHHLALTWNTTHGVRVFVDGRPSASSLTPIKTTPSLVDSATLAIGNKNTQGAVSRWNVSIDELAMWETVLHEAEVRIVYLRSVGLTAEPEETRKAQELEEAIEDRRDDVMRLMYIEFGIVMVVFILVVIHFPDKPPTPPSRSARTKRADFKTGAKALVRSGPFWMLALVYGSTTGVYSGWGAVLNVNLSSFGVSQQESGWIGFYAVLAGVISGLLLARCADFFGGHMKALLLVLFCGSTGCFLWFALLCLDIITFSSDSLYKSSILGGFFVSGTIPLFYELTIETTYPVAEGTTTGLLTLINNLFTVLFLVILMIPDVGTAWMNWCLFGACALCIPVLLAFRESYSRLKVDLGQFDDGDAEPSSAPSSADEVQERQPASYLANKGAADECSKDDAIKRDSPRPHRSRMPQSPWKRLSRGPESSCENSTSRSLLSLESNDMERRLANARESDL